MLLEFPAPYLVKFSLIRLSYILHFFLEHLYFRHFYSALPLSSLDLFLKKKIIFKLLHKTTSPLWMKDESLISSSNVFDVHFKEKWVRPRAMGALTIN